MSQVQTKIAYKVSEITRLIKEALETIVNIWVEGEISNCRIPSSGHIYFTLKDEGSQVRCVIFKYSASNLQFNLKDGMKVLLHGKIGVYEKSGEYQLVADRMLPAGVGELQLAFEQLKRRLQEEGLFDKAHKKAIPLLPKRVGVVTSPTGAAVKDIINVIIRRFENANILIYPAMVQGVGAAEEIAKGIRHLNALNHEYGVEVIIVGRGGGSIEDLWAFNEEVVAKSIYESKIPIVSAVGHEIDYTISDFVADLRAPTPSAAAELVVPEKSQLQGEIENLNLRLTTSLKTRIEKTKREVQALSKSLSPSKMRDSINQNRQQIDSLLSRLILSINHLIESKTQHWAIFSDRLNALSPLRVLERGYSICLLGGSKQIVKDAEQIKLGDEVDLKLFQGELVCKVIGKNGR